MQWHQLDKQCEQSAPHSRQIITPTPHHSIFTGRVLFLTPNQQCQSTEGKTSAEKVDLSSSSFYLPNNTTFASMQF